MMRRVQASVTALGQGWNRFWFGRLPLERTQPLRVGIAVTGLWWIVTLLPHLTEWVAADGWLPLATWLGWRAADPLLSRGVNVSLLAWIDAPLALYSVWALTALALTAMALDRGGWPVRWLAWWLVLSWVLRLQVVVGLFEYLLTSWLFYAVLLPSPRGSAAPAWRSASTAPCIAHLAVRLMQVHLAMIYGTLALSKLSGGAWWNGEAIWWLLAQESSPLVDWTSLRELPYLTQAWTHLVVLFELSFPVLMWKPNWRPLLRRWAVPHWTLLALITGQTGLAWTMGLCTWLLCSIPIGESVDSSSRNALGVPQC